MKGHDDTCITVRLQKEKTSKVGELQQKALMKVEDSNGSCESAVALPQTAKPYPLVGPWVLTVNTAARKR